MYYLCKHSTLHKYFETFTRVKWSEQTFYSTGTVHLCVCVCARVHMCTNTFCWGTGLENRRTKHRFQLTLVNRITLVLFITFTVLSRLLLSCYFLLKRQIKLLKMKTSATPFSAPLLINTLIRKLCGNIYINTNILQIQTEQKQWYFNFFHNKETWLSGS